MDLTFFYRNPKAGFSILKVFRTLENELASRHQMESFDVPSRRADPLSVLKNIWFVFKHRNKRGINHVTGDIHYVVLALIGCKSILTIHDLNVLNRAKNPLKKMFLHLLWFRLPLWLADEVVCISEYTKSELQKISARKDIKVIYNAIDPIHVHNPKAFNDECPVILQIGTGWNKNLNRTIAAVSQIKSHLVIVGEVDVETKTKLENLKQIYTIHCNLTDEQLLQLYNDCDIVIFCSTYEGFGMPIIEGNAVGRCVLTSDISPMTEIGIDAVSTVDPYDIISILNGLRHIINHADYREQLINNGMRNVDRFRVSEIAAQYEEIYERLLIN